MEKSSRSLILAIIAIVLVAVYAGLGALLLIPIVVAAWLVMRGKEKAAAASQAPFEKNVDDLVGEYGEPDESIIINAARANEAVGCILVYRDKGFILADGQQLPITHITGIAAKNSATPYTVGEYQIVITTDIKGISSIRLNAGYDAEWAGQAAAQLAAAIHTD